MKPTYSPTGNSRIKVEVVLGKCGLSSSSISNLDFPGDVTSVSDDTVPIEATKRRLLDNNTGIPTALYTPSPSGRRPLVSSTSKSGKIRMDWSNSPNIARPLLPKPSLNSDIRVIELPAVPSSPHTAVTVRLSNSNKLESTELTTDASAQPTYIQLQQGNTTITRAILPKPTTEQCSSPLLSAEVDEHMETAPLTEEEVLGRRLSRIIKPGFMQVFSKHFKSLPSEPQLLDTALDNRSTLFQLFDFFDWEWNLPIQVPPSVRQAVWTVFHEQFNESLTDMVRFIKRVPGFPILKPQDRILLVRNSGFELAFLVHYLNWNTEFVCWHGPDNFVLTLEQLCTIFPAGMKFFHYAFTNTKRLTKLTQQLQHLGLFAALIILDDELPNLNDRDTVKALRDRVMDAIRYNLKVRQQDVDKVVNRIQVGVQKLRKMGMEHRKVLESLRSDEAFEFPDDLYAELFELISD
ncbi:Nuclear receptor subfamily 1 group D member 3 [Fasciola hepatica]|uniref:Nuclear receptor subfamily 1 group D member 3 n=1 Tax=Fasciola hepatica TaxID=6192 RepID=A0A4E0R2J6_FASHE|nr:Nuclear receptor subfamily 1 group D member 3 [Fasciola hepatica]